MVYPHFNIFMAATLSSRLYLTLRINTALEATANHHWLAQQRRGRVCDFTWGTFKGPFHRTQMKLPLLAPTSHHTFLSRGVWKVEMFLAALDFVNLSESPPVNYYTPPEFLLCSYTVWKRKRSYIRKKIQNNFPRIWIIFKVLITKSPNLFW